SLSAATRGTLEWIGRSRRDPMLCYRIAAGGVALLAASVVNASAQSCLLPWACQEFAEKVEPKTTDVNDDLPSRKGSLRTARPAPRRPSAAGSHQRLALRGVSQRDKMLDLDRMKMPDGEKKEPLLKDLLRQDNQSSASTDQASRDALFEEFLRWRVHQVLVSESFR